MYSPRFWVLGAILTSVEFSTFWKGKSTWQINSIIKIQKTKRCRRIDWWISMRIPIGLPFAKCGIPAWSTAGVWIMNPFHGLCSFVEWCDPFLILGELPRKGLILLRASWGYKRVTGRVPTHKQHAVTTSSTGRLCGWVNTKDILLGPRFWCFNPLAALAGLVPFKM